jgi:fumarate hydratase subunit beta
MNTHQLQTPLVPADLEALRAGDRVFLSGTIYAARDAAHKRLLSELKTGTCPIPLDGSVIYYTGPCPGVIGKPIISAGPTTSSRMDPYTPGLLEQGLRATIGKGERTADVREAQLRHGAVYLVATGGAGVLLAECIKSYTCAAYPELGPEAVLRLEVENMPLIVGNNLHGTSVYERDDAST